MPTTGSNMPKSHGIFVILALLWAAAGCYAYVTQVSMGEAELAAMPDAQRELFLAMPVWVTAAYALAVWLGLAGAVGLLLKRRWAVPLYVASLVAVLVQFGWTFLANDVLGSMGPAALGLPVTIIALGVALVWYSRRAAAKGWLR